jgi:2-dehydropantoate 2-reductase
MKVAVIGAGAIGGYVAARFAKAGNEVSVLLRGKNLEAVKSAGGLKLIEQDDTEFLAPVFATNKISDLGPQDLIILCG